MKTRHTARVTTRFNPGTPEAPTYEILYLAETPVVALQEVKAILGPPGQHVANPKQSDYRSFNVEVQLQGVADLTDPSQQRLLGTSLQELTGNWDTSPPGKAPTQQLGSALFATPGIEAFLAVSAAMPTHKNLVVFPEKLLRGSYLQFDDIITGKLHRILPRRKPKSS